MSTGDIAFSLIGWVVILSGGVWYVRRKKHPSRSTVKAFGIFVGIFGGITLAALFIFVSIWHLLGAEGMRVPPMVGAVLAMIAVLPAWRRAVRTIQRP
jgi:hypothetical protein